MNVTFLIGNGFDLACGLKSSYPDVYEEYIKQPSKSDVVKKFKEDLILNKTKEKWGNWSDFEMGMAEYAKNFKNEKELIECVMDFKDFLQEYLIGQERKFNADYNIIKKEFEYEILNYIKKGVFDFYKGITKKLEKEIDNLGKGYSWQFNFINFNYTGVLKKIISDNINSSKNIINVHGELSEHDVVLGVDNIEQVQANFNMSKKAKRIFVKPYLNSENDPYKVEEIKNIIQTSTCICLFGLSLGDSDLTWKNEIIKWLKGNENHHLFIFDYECSKKNILDLSLKLNEEEDRKEEKLTFFDLSNTEAVSKQIHIPVGKKIFEISTFIEAYHIKQARKNKTA